MNNTVKIFKALADSNRMRILKMLELRHLCVCEITEVLNFATSTISKHLSILREAGLIEDIKDGKWVEYRLNRESKDPEITKILSLLPDWLKEDEVVKKDAEKVKTADRNVICNKEKYN